MKKLFLLSLAACLTLIGCGQASGNSGGTGIETSQSQNVPSGNSGGTGIETSQSQNVPEGYHLVTFNSNGGSPVESQIVRDGGKASKPKDPTKLGYDFINWTYYGEEWSFIGYSVTEDMTLDANWSIIDYNITYVLNGGTNDPNNPSCFSVESKDLSLRDPTRLGCEFLGWRLDGEAVSSIDPHWLRDVTLEAAWAPSKGNEDILDFDIVVNGDRVVATKYHGNKANVTIPSVVTSIGDGAFSGCSSLTSVVIPDSVTSIGYRAFYNCLSLKNTYIRVSSIEAFLAMSGKTDLGGNVHLIDASTGEEIKDVAIPDSVTSIGDFAFLWCTSLTSVTIPDSVTSIGYLAFYNCLSLKNTYIRVSSIEAVLAMLGKTDLGGNVHLIDASTGEEIKDVVIPDSVTSIGDDVFSGCSSLTSIVIPDSVASIGDYAFRRCSSLTSVTIGVGVTSIGDSAFYDCYRLAEVINLSSLEISKGSEEYGYVAYYALGVVSSASESKLHMGQDGIATYADGPSVTLVGYFGESRDVTIPDSVTSIGRYAFYGCTSLTSVTIPDSVASIGEYAFCDCYSMVSVTIGVGVTSIGGYAFFCCSRLAEVINLSSLDISKGSEEYGYVGRYALGVVSSASESKLHMGQDGIATYADGPSVTLVGYFGDEASVAIPASVTSIGNAAFYDCSSLTSVTIPDSVTSISDSAFSGCSSLTSVVIPASVTSIGDATFYGCTSLISIDIPDFVTSIGDAAFYGCTSLISIDIPDFVTSIGDHTFYGCTSLTSIVIPDSVTSIGNYAFRGCTSLTSVTIGNGVTSIGDYAFYECSFLTSVTIPDSVTSIGEIAFEGCSLLQIFYAGTNAQWESIDGNDEVSEGKVYYYSETEPTNDGRYWHYVDGVPTPWSR